jgi:hypothetical protein
LDLSTCFLNQFLPVALPLSLEQALVFPDRHNHYVGLAPTFDDNSLVILYGLPHQFAKADSCLGGTYYTAHAILLSIN